MEPSQICVKSAPLSEPLNSASSLLESAPASSFRPSLGSKLNQVKSQEVPPGEPEKEEETVSKEVLVTSPPPMTRLQVGHEPEEVAALAAALVGKKRKQCKKKQSSTQINKRQKTGCEDSTRETTAKVTPVTNDEALALQPQAIKVGLSTAAGTVSSPVRKRTPCKRRSRKQDKEEQSKQCQLSPLPKSMTSSKFATPASKPVEAFEEQKAMKAIQAPKPAEPPCSTKPLKTLAKKPRGKQSVDKLACSKQQQSRNKRTTATKPNRSRKKAAPAPMIIDPTLFETGDFLSPLKAPPILGLENEKPQPDPVAPPDDPGPPVRETFGSPLLDQIDKLSSVDQPTSTPPQEEPIENEADQAATSTNAHVELMTDCPPTPPPEPPAEALPETSRDEPLANNESPTTAEIPAQLPDNPLTARLKQIQKERRAFVESEESQQVSLSDPNLDREVHRELEKEAQRAAQASEEEGRCLVNSGDNLASSDLPQVEERDPEEKEPDEEVKQRGPSSDGEPDLAQSAEAQSTVLPQEENDKILEPAPSPLPEEGSSSNLQQLVEDEPNAQKHFSKVQRRNMGTLKSILKANKMKQTPPASERDIEEGDWRHNCCICFDSIKERTKPENCQHIFCLDCILGWTERYNVCPLCKREIKILEKFDTVNEDKVSERIEVDMPKNKEDEEPLDGSLLAPSFADNCLVCKKNDREDQQIVCEHCDFEIAHIDCLGFSEVPDDQWFCPTCVKKIKKKQKLDDEKRKRFRQGYIAGIKPQAQPTRRSLRNCWYDLNDEEDKENDSLYEEEGNSGETGKIILPQRRLRPKRDSPDMKQEPAKPCKQEPKRKRKRSPKKQAGGQSGSTEDVSFGSIIEDPQKDEMDKLLSQADMMLGRKSSKPGTPQKSPGKGTPQKDFKPLKKRRVIESSESETIGACAEESSQDSDNLNPKSRPRPSAFAFSASKKGSKSAFSKGGKKKAGKKVSPQEEEPVAPACPPNSSFLNQSLNLSGFRKFGTQLTKSDASGSVFSNLPRPSIQGGKAPSVQPSMIFNPQLNQIHCQQLQLQKQLNPIEKRSMLLGRPQPKPGQHLESSSFASPTLRGKDKVEGAPSSINKADPNRLQASSERDSPGLGPPKSVASKFSRIQAMFPSKEPPASNSLPPPPAPHTVKPVSNSVNESADKQRPELPQNQGLAEPIPNNEHPKETSASSRSQAAPSHPSPKSQEQAEGTPPEPPQASCQEQALSSEQGVPEKISTQDDSHRVLAPLEQHANNHLGSHVPPEQATKPQETEKRLPSTSLNDKTLQAPVQGRSEANCQSLPSYSQATVAAAPAIPAPLEERKLENEMKEEPAEPSSVPCPNEANKAEEQVSIGVPPRSSQQPCQPQQHQVSSEALPANPKLSCSDSPKVPSSSPAGPIVRPNVIDSGRSFDPLQSAQEVIQIISDSENSSVVLQMGCQAVAEPMSLQIKEDLSTNEVKAEASASAKGAGSPEDQTSTKIGAGDGGSSSNFEGMRAKKSYSNGHQERSDSPSRSRPRSKPPSPKKRKDKSDDRATDRQSEKRCRKKKKKEKRVTFRLSQNETIYIEPRECHLQNLQMQQEKQEKSPYLDPQSMNQFSQAARNDHPIWGDPARTEPSRFEAENSGPMWGSRRSPSHEPIRGNEWREEQGRRPGDYSAHDQRPPGSFYQMENHWSNGYNKQPPPESEPFVNPWTNGGQLPWKNPSQQAQGNLQQQQPGMEQQQPQGQLLKPNGFTRFDSPPNQWANPSEAGAVQPGSTSVYSSEPKKEPTSEQSSPQSSSNQTTASSSPEKQLSKRAARRLKRRQAQQQQAQTDRVPTGGSGGKEDPLTVDLSSPELPPEVQTKAEPPRQADDCREPIKNDPSFSLNITPGTPEKPLLVQAGHQPIKQQPGAQGFNQGSSHQQGVSNPMQQSPGNQQFAPPPGYPQFNGHQVQGWHQQQWDGPHQAHLHQQSQQSQQQQQQPQQQPPLHQPHQQPQQPGQKPGQQLLQPRPQANFHLPQQPSHEPPAQVKQQQVKSSPNSAQQPSQQAQHPFQPPYPQAYPGQPYYHQQYLPPHPNMASTPPQQQPPHQAQPSQHQQPIQNTPATQQSSTHPPQVQFHPQQAIQMPQGIAPAKQEPMDLSVGDATSQLSFYQPMGYYMPPPAMGQSQPSQPNQQYSQQQPFQQQQCHPPNGYGRQAQPPQPVQPGQIPEQPTQLQAQPGQLQGQSPMEVKKDPTGGVPSNPQGVFQGGSQAAVKADPTLLPAGDRPKKKRSKKKKSPPKANSSFAKQEPNQNDQPPLSPVKLQQTGQQSSQSPYKQSRLDAYSQTKHPYGGGQQFQQQLPPSQQLPNHPQQQPSHSAQQLQQQQAPPISHLQAPPYQSQVQQQVPLPPEAAEPEKKCNSFFGPRGRVPAANNRTSIQSQQSSESNVPLGFGSNNNSASSNSRRGLSNGLVAREEDSANSNSSRLSSGKRGKDPRIKRWFIANGRLIPVYHDEFKKKKTEGGAAPVARR